VNGRIVERMEERIVSNISIKNNHRVSNADPARQRYKCKLEIINGDTDTVAEARLRSLQRVIGCVGKTPSPGAGVSAWLLVSPPANHLGELRVSKCRDRAAV
jgi:hypothetical protein